MGLFSALNTSVSGMAAQASKLGTIGDNIANSGTTGYKRASTEFETLLGNQSTSDYQSGGVSTQVRYGITDQGSINATTSATDLAIDGDGFFVAEDSSGAQVMTRAGSFLQQKDGTLQNTAGLTLMGYNLANGSNQSGSSGLVPINVGGVGLTASPSTAATLSVNLPSTAATAATTALPGANTTASTYAGKQIITAYDNLGTPVTLDMYMQKSGVDASGNPQWQVAVYNEANATNGGFPYGASASSPMATQTITFSKTTGAVLSGGTVSVAIPNGSTLSIDMSKSTQLASAYAVSASDINGSSPASLASINIDNDGVVTQVYSNGVKKATYQVALATVASPDLLTPVSGDAYTTNNASGSMIVAGANSNGLGKIDSASLEGSTVDLATELTNMIEAQRGYEANSKVLQTASDLLGVINNIHT
jgi:flagellar hook protein FlgE